MTVAVDLYRYGQKWGSGTGTPGSASVTSYSGVAPGSINKAVQVVLTTGTDTGRSYSTRVATDAGATLTLKDTVPFS